MHLLSLHWNRQHHSFLTTYRPAFMRDMACAGPYYSKLLLNAIYFGASKFSPRSDVRKDPNDVRTAGWRFRERIRELLVTSLERSEVTTIQALLIMTNSLFALGDERSAAWLYAGLAFRMIIDMGIHVDVTDVATARNYSDEDLEIRRRVFWAAFGRLGLFVSIHVSFFCSCFVLLLFSSQSVVSKSLIGASCSRGQGPKSVPRPTGHAQRCRRSGTAQVSRHV
jgi:hypothetical protein